MIAPECFTFGWLREQAEATKARDPRNLEKCILALELVSRMRRAGLDFLFKGGTSLVLLFDPVRRLSIDVDILSLEPLEKVREVLEATTKDRPPFLAWTHQEHRDREAPPTRHFRALYSSALDPSGTHSIQVDVITAENPYAEIEVRTVLTPFIRIDEDVRVVMPTASSLLGDKLATFAPATIGYPYQPIIAATGEPGEPRPIKVVKHLFDVGELAGVAGNLSQTVETYRRVHAEQLRYRNSAWSIDQTLDDTQDASFWVGRLDGSPLEENAKTAFFRSGIRALDSHLFTLPFQRAESRLAAGRAALVAELIRRDVVDFDLPAFIGDGLDVEALRGARLEGPWENLNRLKQTDPRAFACWHQAQEFRGR